VPRLVNYVGVAKDMNSKPLTGVVGATFAVYAEREGGPPLWIETQNIHAAANGSFSVMLGATKPEGLPQDLFSSGQARWLGGSYNGGAEQPRVALLSVPYALKAGDAQTLGGLPPSAFAFATPPSSSTVSVSDGASAAAPATAPPPAGTVTGTGTLDFFPLWTSTSNIGNSALFQSGSGSAAKVGINTTTPAATLDVKGTTNLEGLVTSPALGAATSTAGKSSQAHDFVASSFNSSTSAAVNQTFQWKAEATGNNTATPSGTLNLLFGSGTASPSETGLKLSNKGLFTFASSRLFQARGQGR
jgi:trimeric autotransporter adhesin